MISRSESLRRAYFGALAFTGLGPRLRARHGADALFVLNFHRVEPRHDAFTWPVHPRDFEALIIHLKSHFRIRTICDDDDANGRPGAVLSFDDGYRSFIDYVAPILHRHRIRANLNLIVDAVVGGEPPWHVRLYDFLSSAPKAGLRALRLSGFDVPPPGDGDAARTRFGLAISRFLKNRPRAERESLLAELAPLTEAVSAAARTQMLSLQDVREVSSLVECGAHSVHHDSMAFETEQYFREDVRACGRFFREDLGADCAIYAFPNGSYRPEQLDAARSEGVQKLLVVDERVATRGDWVLPRLTMYGRSSAELTLRAQGYGAGQGQGRVRD